MNPQSIPCAPSNWGKGIGMRRRSREVRSRDGGWELPSALQSIMTTLLSSAAIAFSGLQHA